MKILITGGSGFIGKHLCTRLSSLGHEVIALSRSHGDISDPATLAAYDGKEIEHVFHLASNTFVPKSWSNPFDFIGINVKGTNAVLDYCVRNKCSLTYISTYVYGVVKQNPIQESTPLQPNNPYALSKKIGEDLCEFYSKYYNLNVVILRPFNAYGSGQDENFLIPSLIRQVKAKGEVNVLDLSPKRDYVYVDDVVECMLSTINCKKFGIYNVGSGRSHSVKEVIETLFELTGNQLPVKSENSVRKNEIPDTIADISLAAKELNWKPSVTLREGLSKML